MTEARHVDSLIKGGAHVAMVMTMIGDRHTSRPMICLDVTGDRLSFLVDQNDEWVQGIVRGQADSVGDDVAAGALGLKDDRDGIAHVDTVATDTADRSQFLEGGNP